MNYIKGENLNGLELAKIAATAAADKKAKRMILLDLKGRSDLCDYQFICSGESDRQTKAICESIEDALRIEGKTKPYAIEGKINGNWILLDFGALSVHVFLDQLRDYYALEQLWPNVKFVDISTL